MLAEEPVMQVEDGRHLVKREGDPRLPQLSQAYRDLWKLTVIPNDGELVLTRFEVEPDEERSTEGLPAASVIATIHYTRKRPVTEFVSFTYVSKSGPLEVGEPLHRSCPVAAFGNSLVLPDDLARAFFSLLPGVPFLAFGCSDALPMHKDREVSKQLVVRLAMETIALDRARTMFSRRGLELPELGHGDWSITLPATSEELEEIVDQ